MKRGTATHALPLSFCLAKRYDTHADLNSLLNSLPPFKMIHHILPLYESPQEITMGNTFLEGDTRFELASWLVGDCTYSNSSFLRLRLLASKLTMKFTLSARILVSYIRRLGRMLPQPRLERGFLSGIELKLRLAKY